MFRLLSTNLWYLQFNLLVHFKQSTSAEPTLNSPATQFQFLCSAATSYNSFLLTTNVSFCLTFAALNTPNSPLSLQKSPSHNALTQLSPSFGRSYSNLQLPSLQQPKIASRVFLLFLFILPAVLFSIHTDSLHTFPSPQLSPCQPHIISHHNSILPWPVLSILTFKRRIKSHLPFAGIIRSSPYSPRFQNNG